MRSFSAVLSIMADRLVEIGANDLQNLKNLYKSDGSKSYIAYMTIDNYLQWFQQDPNIKHVRIFCLNGDYSDGTFVITVSIHFAHQFIYLSSYWTVNTLNFNQDRCHAYADTFNASHEKLDRLLRLIDYSKGYTFISVRPELRPVIKNALIKANVEDVFDDEVLMYYLPKEDALQMDVQWVNDKKWFKMKYTFCEASCFQATKRHIATPSNRLPRFGKSEFSVAAQRCKFFSIPSETGQI